MTARNHHMITVAPTTVLAMALSQHRRGPGQHACLAIVEHPAERVDVAGDDRGAGRHDLGEDHAKALAAGIRRTVHIDAAHGTRFGHVVGLAEHGIIRNH